MNRDECFHIRAAQFSDAAEPLGQHFGDVFPHVADAQRIDEPGQRRFFRPIERLDQILRRFLPHALQG